MSLLFVFHQNYNNATRKWRWIWINPRQPAGSTFLTNGYLATLATRAPVPSHQSSYVSVLANILEFFNRTSELCNHSDPSPLMTLRVGQRYPWQPPVAWEEKWLEREKKGNVGQHKWGKSCQIWVWSSFTISLVGAHGYQRGADLRAPPEGKQGWHHRWRRKRAKIKVFFRSTGQMFLTLSVLHWRDRRCFNLKKMTPGVDSKIIKTVEHWRWIHSLH